MQPRAPAKVKGAVVRPMAEWFAATCGEQALRDVGERLSARVRGEITLDAPALGILPAGWYTEALASELAEAIVRGAAPVVNETAAVRQIGRVIVDRSLGRISRAAIEWFVSPEIIARSAPTFWRMYHDSGVVSARVDGPSLHAVCRDWAEHGVMWCRVVGGSATRVLELAGCRDARVWVHRCGGGRGDCTLTFRWAGA